MKKLLFLSTICLISFFASGDNGFILKLEGLEKNLLFPNKKILLDALFFFQKIDLYVEKQKVILTLPPDLDLHFEDDIIAICDPVKDENDVIHCELAIKIIELKALNLKNIYPLNVSKEQKNLRAKSS